jgi:hypothetical protein
MSAQQYAQILRLCKTIDADVQKLRRAMKDLQAFQAKTATRIDLLRSVIEHGSTKN